VNPRGEPSGKTRKLADTPTETWVFAGVTGIYAVSAVIYGVFADDPAGFALLLGAALLTGTYTLYFRRHIAAVQENIEEQEEGARPNELYLPEQSLWPFGTGLGVTIILAGFAIGLWLSAAGLVILARSVVGLVAESRRRG
jgi:hypothetical protein